MISLFYSKGMALVYDISVLLKGHGAGLLYLCSTQRAWRWFYDISVLLKGHGAGFMISLFYSKGMALVL